MNNKGILNYLVMAAFVMAAAFTSCDKDDVRFTSWYAYDGPYHLKLQFKDKTVVTLDVTNTYNAGIYELDIYSGNPILGKYTRSGNIVNMTLYIDGGKTEVTGTIDGKTMEVIFVYDEVVLLFVRE